MSYFWGSYSQLIMSWGLTVFSFSALFLGAIGYLLSKNNKHCLLILTNLFAFNLLTFINIKGLGAHYYLVIAAIESLFIAKAHQMKSQSLILRILLISIVYNGLSLIEYGTKYSVIHSHYVIVMQVLIAGMVFCIFKYGVLNGFGNTNNKRNVNQRNIGDSSLYSGKAP